MSEWQPIETAPRDGSDCLLYGPEANDGNPWREVGRWVPRRYFHQGMRWEEGGDWEGFGGTIYWEPTHWMPLPAPPEGKP